MLERINGVYDKKGRLNYRKGRQRQLGEGMVTIEGWQGIVRKDSMERTAKKCRKEMAAM